MKNIQIRNVPDRTHSVLRRRAAESGMSLQEYVLGLLRESAERPTVDEVLERAARRQSRVTVEEVVREIRSDRDSR